MYTYSLVRVIDNRVKRYPILRVNVLTQIGIAKLQDLETTARAYCPAEHQIYDGMIIQVTWRDC